MELIPVAGMKVNQGGLMRCCLESLNLYLAERDSVEDGTVIGCRYHKDPDEPQMILRGHVWFWVGAGLA